mmetsp:Transcript_10311/g.30838  ORF Transcript_10311/g.30838 Transcript_10311/m.30838 type:complete len:272 (-) Transcript_10311:641-1456(-)
MCSSHAPLTLTLTQHTHTHAHAHTHTPLTHSSWWHRGAGRCLARVAVLIADLATGAAPVIHGVVDLVPAVEERDGAPLRRRPDDAKDEVDAPHDREGGDQDVLVMVPPELLEDGRAEKEAHQEATDVRRVAHAVVSAAADHTDDGTRVEDEHAQGQEDEAEVSVLQVPDHLALVVVLPVEHEVPEVHANEAIAVAGRANDGKVRVTKGDGESAADDGEDPDRSQAKGPVHVVERHAQDDLDDGVAGEVAIADVADGIGEVPPHLSSLVSVR